MISLFSFWLLSKLRIYKQTNKQTKNSYPHFIYSFKNPVLGPNATPQATCDDYEIGLEQLSSLTRENNISALQQYGGVSELNMYMYCIDVFWSYNIINTNE